MFALCVPVIAVIESLRDDGIRDRYVLNWCCAICSTVHPSIGGERFVHAPR
jgi:hypothetical protein